MHMHIILRADFLDCMHMHRYDWITFFSNCIRWIMYPLDVCPSYASNLPPSESVLRTPQTSGYLLLSPPRHQSNIMHTVFVAEEEAPSHSSDPYLAFAPFFTKRNYRQIMSSTPMTPPAPMPSSPKMYLVLTNISKRNNIKSLLQTAAACGCSAIFVVGQRTFDFDKDLPQSLHAYTNDDEQKIMPIIRFVKWNDCVQHLVERNITLVGVEIHKDAHNLDSYTSTNNKDNNKDVAFLMGNEGQGIHEKHMASCQDFVKIPQYGGGTASLNVNVAASIVLHSYHLNNIK